MKTLVTGAAGFIGYHLSKKLLARGDTVVGIDNLSDYYSVDLKRGRLRQLEGEDRFRFDVCDIADRVQIPKLFTDEEFDVVFHMAAQAGVRYSITNPQAYVDSNLVGFGNILEACRHNGVKHLVYASSSSVYGANRRYPFSESHNVDHPISLYAATKKANELMAHSYSHLYRLPTTGLRFFTVYGPWGRPDMAVYLFTKAILEGSSIDVFNDGRMRRDFTYVDDIVEGVIRTGDQVPAGLEAWDAESPDPATGSAPYAIYNIGNQNPVELLRMIEILEGLLGRSAKKRFLPMQAGDVLETSADVTRLYQAVGFEPKTPIEDGLRRFVDWYLAWHGTTK